MHWLGVRAHDLNFTVTSVEFCPHMVMFQKTGHIADDASSPGWQLLTCLLGNQAQHHRACLS